MLQPGLTFRLDQGAIDPMYKDAQIQKARDFFALHHEPKLLVLPNVYTLVDDLSNGLRRLWRSTGEEPEPETASP